ncbi:unnamed protein product [Adineta steineri]|uniref:Cadherin domain-containing protein n=1 Tax=Adineta steineri TaxID=433720 RepID=A0A814FQB5_9BILA|nr:unnamed protein product [Adineta steineri]
MSRLWLWFIVNITIIQARYIRLPTVNCSESSPIGTSITQLLDVLPLSNWEFTFLTQTSLKTYFLLDNLKGTITIKRLLDRENLCHLNLCSCSNECLIKLEINAISDIYTHLLSLPIIIFDENDNYCYFSNEIFHLNISENIRINTRIILPLAYDPDLTPNNIQSYYFQTNNYTEFYLDNHLTPSIIIMKELDRELIDKYDFNFCAYEGINEHKRSCCTKIIIKITDINDNSAKFQYNQRLPFIINVSELTAINTELIQMKAFDPDEGLNGQIEYSFSKWTLLDKTIQHIFYLDSNNGSIILLKQLDYEKRNNYELQIQAKDLGPNAIPTYATVIIQVIDENDCIPEIYTFSPPDIPLINNTIINIFENISLNTPILYLTVSDCDTGENGRVTIELISSNSIVELQNIDNNTSILLINTFFDREEKSSHTFSIIIYDHGKPPHSLINTFDLHLMDINDCFPYFNSSINYTFIINENNKENYLLHTIQAYDLDENDQITLDLKFSNQHDKNLFYINKQNQLIIRKSLDYEHQSFYYFTLIAQDLIGHQTLMPIYIYLNDLNDNPVKFLKNFTQLKIQDNQPSGTFLTHIQAEDKDKNYPIMYYIHPFDLNYIQNFLELNPNGSLYTKVKFDSKRITKLHFRIIANDSLYIDMITIEILISYKPILKTSSPYCFVIQNHDYIRIQLESYNNVSFSIRNPSSTDLKLFSNGTLIVKSLIRKYSFDIYLEDNSSSSIFTNFKLSIQPDCGNHIFNEQMIIICLIFLIIIIILIIIYLCLQQKQVLNKQINITPSSSLNDTLFFSSSPSPQFTAMTIISSPSSSSSTHQQTNQSSSLSSSTSSTYIKMSRSFDDDMI